MEEELSRAQDELELRIQERTAELVKTNKTLQAEITERKSAEEALKKSEEKYRKLIDNIQDGVFIIQDSKFNLPMKHLPEWLGIGWKKLSEKTLDNLLHLRI